MAGKALNLCDGGELSLDLLDETAHVTDRPTFEEQHEDAAAGMGTHDGCRHIPADDLADVLQRRMVDGGAVELLYRVELWYDEHGTDVADLLEAQVVGELDASEDHAAVVVEARLLIDEVEPTLQPVVVALLFDIAEFAEQPDDRIALIDGVLRERDGVLAAARDAAAVDGFALLEDVLFSLVHVRVGEMPAEVAVGLAEELVDILDAVVAQESRACAAEPALLVLPEELAVRELRQRPPERSVGDLALLILWQVR